jgi:hypothetical protein
MIQSAQLAATTASSVAGAGSARWSARWPTAAGVIQSYAGLHCLKTSSRSCAAAASGNIAVFTTPPPRWRGIACSWSRARLRTHQR